ncbi:MAG TPA: toll/interleukin-1 receptor domain-containing protein [Rubrivivax sp.]|nr:toll/interleukin-1 receptor domain-containing protein [Rubrivivax sp.]
MKLFLSYPSGQRDLAERLTFALEAEGHEVFIDRSELKAGESFHQRLRESILGADAMVFLVTPDSVRPGSYALAELNIAQQHWRRPSGRVLPVVVSPTPIAAMPPYLTAVTVLEPRGDAVAEIVAAVAQLAPPSRAWRKWLVGGAAVLAIAVVGIFLISRQAEQAAADAARHAAEQRDLAQAMSARELCFTGGHTVALAQLNEMAARIPVLAPVLDAREDCAMRWLRDMRAVAGKQTFSEQVAQAQPLLFQGMARAAANERMANLRAHIGWGEYLRSRDGIAGVDPVPHWKRALAEDPGNAYAHAMWARQLLDKPGRFDEARTHFAADVSQRSEPTLRARIAVQYAASRSERRPGVRPRGCRRDAPRQGGRPARSSRQVLDQRVRHADARTRRSCRRAVVIAAAGPAGDLHLALSGRRGQLGTTPNVALQSGVVAGQQGRHGRGAQGFPILGWRIAGQRAGRTPSRRG